MVAERVERHRQAAATHDAAAKRYGDAVRYWRERGDVERAGREERDVDIERAAAALERDRAAFYERHPDAP